MCRFSRKLAMHLLNAWNDFDGGKTQLNKYLINYYYTCVVSTEFPPIIKSEIPCRWCIFETTFRILAFTSFLS
jgi:hypothetical protein